MAKFYLLTLVLSSLAMAETSSPGGQEYHFRVDAMMCSSCVSKVKKSIEAHKGISNVHVNLETHEASFVCKSEKDCPVSAVQADLRRIGYPAKKLEAVQN